MVKVESETAAPDIQEQTPQERADLAWQVLAQRISPHTIKGFLNAELAYQRSLRTETDPPSKIEILLARTGGFRSKIEREDTVTFFDDRLAAAIKAKSLALETGIELTRIEQRIQTCGAVILFINKSLPQMPQRRWQ